MEMTPMKRPLAAASAAVLLGLSLAACGGGAGGAPDDASEKEFCETVAGPDGAEDVKDDDFDGQADALHDWADDLKDVGTPKGIPGDARDGFEIQIEALSDIDGGDLEKASDDDGDFLADEFSDDDQDKVKAFTKYQIETCTDTPGSTDDSDESDDSEDSDGSDSSSSDEESDDDGGTGPGVSEPTDLPTGVPTDLSDLPSDFPTDPEELQSYLETAFPTE